MTTPTMITTTKEAPLTPENLLSQEISRVHMKKGYDIEFIDAFLREVVDTWKQLVSDGSSRARADGPRLTPEDVLEKEIPNTRFKEGYDLDDVDELLDDVVVIWRRLERPQDPEVNLDSMSTQQLVILNQEVSKEIAERLLE